MGRVQTSKNAMAVAILLVVACAQSHSMASAFHVAGASVLAVPADSCFSNSAVTSRRRNLRKHVNSWTHLPVSRRFKKREITNMQCCEGSEESRGMCIGGGLAFEEWLQKRRDRDSTNSSGHTRTSPACDSSAQKSCMKPADILLNAELVQRVEAVEAGAGRLFRVRTQAGTLKVHSHPENPYRSDNVVAQLFDGQIVQTVGRPQRGQGRYAQYSWEQHSGGGWSIREVAGFQCLVPMEDP